jgi:hypothetical protein
MSVSKAEKRAQLLAKAEAAIEVYLEWEETHPAPNLMEIEEIALKVRKEFGQAIAQIALDTQPAQTPVPGPPCAQCGQEMRYKGQKTTQVESRTGPLKVERGYYYCPQCQAGFFPPGSPVAVISAALE